MICHVDIIIILCRKKYNNNKMPRAKQKPRKKIPQIITKSVEEDALVNAEENTGGPILAIEGSSIATQRDIINNLNAYLSKSEEVELAKLLNIDSIPSAPKHLVQISKPRKKRVRFANIVEKVGDGAYEVILQYLKSIRTNICIIGNGGAGVAGFVYLLANEPELNDITLIWHGGNSDVNFKYSFALNIGLTYEPHIEQEFIKKLGGDPKKDIQTLFINKLKIFIPDGDPLKLRYRVSKSKKKNDSHAIIGESLVESFMHGHTIRKKAIGRYASRYNHSAIGEHDKILMTAGARKIVKDRKKLDLGFGVPRKNDKIERLSHILGQTAIVANQTWYPPSVLAYSLKNDCYHLNDESFFCDVLNKGEISEDNILDSLWINNPCQMWRQPYNRTPIAERVINFLQGNEEFIYKFNDKITFEDRTPIYFPDPNINYIQEYLALQWRLQTTAPIRFMQEWTFMNYEATVYAQIVQKHKKFETTSETFRERLNELINERRDAQKKES